MVPAAGDCRSTSYLPHYIAGITRPVTVVQVTGCQPPPVLVHLLHVRCGASPAGSKSCTVDRMSAQAADHPNPNEPYQVIHLGGEAAAVVPLAELRRLRAVERHASPEALEGAEIEATLAAHDEWVAEGCPGARSHEDVMAELLGSGR